jgi:DNA-binding NarL/FixJ family response regulator
MCAVFIFIGLYHLLIYAFRKTDHYNLLFIGFTAITALYYFAQAQIIYSILPNTAFGQRLDYALMYILIFTGVAFLENINRGKTSKITAAYGVFGVTLAVVQWFFPIWFSYELVSIWRYTTIFYVAYVIAADMLWPIYKGSVKLNKDADSKPGLWRGIYRYLFQTELGNIYIMLTIVGLTVIVDIANIAMFNTNFPLKNYSLLGFTMGTAFILAQKYSNRPETAAPVFAEQAQNLASAGLTQEETEVALLMIEGTTRRDIARKLNINATEVSGYETVIRQRLGLPGEADTVIVAVAREYGLTKRESEILKYLRENATTEEIAADLFISEVTVRSHVSNLLSKLGIAKRQDVAMWLEKRE